MNLRIDCHKCKKTIKQSESHLITIESKYFGVIGDVMISVCLGCFREHQLIKLGMTE